MSTLAKACHLTSKLEFFDYIFRLHWKFRRFTDLLVLINEKCGNPEVVADGGELTRNINQKIRRRSQAPYKPVDAHRMRNAIDKNISSTSI